MFNWRHYLYIYWCIIETRYVPHLVTRLEPQDKPIGSPRICFRSNSTFDVPDQYDNFPLFQCISSPVNWIANEISTAMDSSSTSNNSGQFNLLRSFNTLNDSTVDVSDTVRDAVCVIFFLLAYWAEHFDLETVSIRTIKEATWINGRIQLFTWILHHTHSSRNVQHDHYM